MNQHTEARAPNEASSLASPVENKEQFARDAADRIERRARRCSRIFYLFALTLFTATYALVAMGTLKYFDNQKYANAQAPLPVADAAIQARIAALAAAEKNTPPVLNAGTENPGPSINERISRALDEWERVEKIERDSSDGEPVRSPWAATVTHGLLIFGLIVIMGFLIQIALMFMRYYARLAEFLDAQVEALRLSEGNVEVAIQFMKQLSPDSIEVGRRSPT